MNFERQRTLAPTFLRRAEMTIETPKSETERPPLTQPITPDAPNTGSPMDDEPEPGTDPLHEGP